MRTAAPPEKSPTREKLLEAALGLMLQNGYSATGVEEVCQAARVTKGSFFHYFRSKEDLGRAVLDRFVQAQREIALKSPHVHLKDPLDRVLGFLDFVIAKSRQPEVLRGCLLGTFAQELAHTHEGIRQECEAKFGEWTGSLKGDLDQAVRLHPPAASVDTRSLADHIVAALEGAIILAKARKDPKPIRESMAHLKGYLRGIFRR